MSLSINNRKKSLKDRSSTFIIKILLAIILGSMFGIILGDNPISNVILRFIVTFSDLVSQFLSFFVPIVVLGLTMPSIIGLGDRASKMLIIIVGLSYISLLLVGFFCMFLGYSFIPDLIGNYTLQEIGESSTKNIVSFFPTLLNPFLDVVGAIVLAFTLGLGAALVKTESLNKVIFDIEKVIYFVLGRFVIKILPIYIACIFAKLAYSGELQSNLKNFSLIIFAIFLVSNAWMLISIILASIFSKKSVLSSLRAYAPAYFVAFGTQSSKATIPVSLESAEKIGISKEVREFAVPMLATIHLLGSMVTQTLGSLAVYYIFVGEMISFSLMFSYIFVLATLLLAAPGIPGGEPVATKPLLTSFLGFPPTVAEIMFTLGVANDSFATAVNVTADNPIIIVLDSIYKKIFK